MEAHDCIRATYFKIKLSDECLEDLKKYTANVLSNPNAHKDYTTKLAGHIKKGKQLQIPLQTKEVKDLVSVLSSAATQYYNDYLKRGPLAAIEGVNSDHPFALKGIQMQDLWLNSYYAGDYNPIHKHGTTSPIGLSCFIIINVPESIKRTKEHKTVGDLGLVTGNDHFDGHTLLQWGYNYASDSVMDSLEYVQQEYVKPEEGMIYLFPRWMSHLVNPFQGPGVRVTMAANINIWTNKYYDIYNSYSEKMSKKTK